MKLVYSNYPKHGINGYLRKGRQILCFGPAVKNIICCFPATVLYVYIDFYQQVKTTKHMHVLYVDIPRMPFQNRFQACFDHRMFSREKSLKASIVQIPMTKADLFLGIFEAISGTL